MKLCRFMSAEEVGKLINGDTIKNTTDHKGKGARTNAVGACFFIMGERELFQCHRFLSGIVDSEYCLVVDIDAVPEGWAKCQGVYFNYDKDEIAMKRVSEATEIDGITALIDMLEELSDPAIKEARMVELDEYCTTQYKLSDFARWEIRKPTHEHSSSVKIGGDEPKKIHSYEESIVVCYG